MEPSKRSTRPRSRQMPRVEAWFSSFSFSELPAGAAARWTGVGSVPTSASTCLDAAVGVEEIAGNIDNLVAVPGHAQAVLVGDRGDDDSLDVLLGSCGNKRVYVLLRGRRQPCAPAIRRWPARCRPDRRTSSARRSGRCPDRRPARRWQRIRRPRRSRCSA